MDTKDEFRTGDPTQRSGMVSLVGRANVGKSSLLNRILEEKVSIVSATEQTTRNVIRGIYTEPRGQLVFIDTPGMHQPRAQMGREMNKLARKAAEGVDLVLLLLDATEAPRREDEGWMRRILQRRLPAALVLNKNDRNLVHRNAFETMLNELKAELDPEADLPWLETSAATGDGLPEFVDFLFDRMPHSPLLFPEGVLSDFPTKLLISDIIREKYFRDLRDEVPHQLGVWVQEAIDQPDGSMLVLARVYVRRESHKGIVIGHKGRLLRKVKRAASQELEEIYEKPVKLEITIRVDKKWQDNYFILRQIGQI